MKILWLNWKDLKHPLAGGAEVLNEELCKRLVQDGHEVILLTSQFKGGLDEEIINGYKVIRVGGRYSVYWKAYQYYKRNLQGWADLVIDEVNTIPFFAKFYAKENNILFIHQLCREIWFYEMPKVIGFIGFFLEPLYLRMLSNKKTITVSNSSKRDIMRFGFKENNIHIISEGIEFEPVNDLNIEKYVEPTILILGSVRSMKRTLDGVKAFEIAKKSLPTLQLKLAGSMNGSYAYSVKEYIDSSEFRHSIDVMGKVDIQTKKELMQRSHIIVVTSVKEGWGLIVTEANSQGTPAVVYNVDGLRDSVIKNETGLVTDVNPESIAAGIIKLIKNPKLYNELRVNAWNKSKEINFNKAYSDFKLSLNI
jgi:glycosyltransferase involved in cell wall biosynthesis